MNRNKNIIYFLIALFSILNLFLLTKEIEKVEKLSKNIKELHCIELANILLEKENISSIRNKCHFYSATGKWDKRKIIKLSKEKK